MSEFCEKASTRVRRARMWLGAALVVHVLTLVAIVAGVACDGVPATTPATAGIVLASLPLIILVWYERRRPSIDRPGCWPVRGLVVAVPQAAGFAMVSAGQLAPTPLAPWQRIVLIAAVPVLLQTAAALAAKRSVLRPLTPELGMTNLEVRVPLRSNRLGTPRWLCTEDVRLTDQEIITILQPGPAWRAMHRIALVDISAVDARPATPRDNPWITLDDGSGYAMLPGDVVVVHHRGGVQVLPTYDAAAFADVIRVRGQQARARRA